MKLRVISLSALTGILAMALNAGATCNQSFAQIQANTSSVSNQLYSSLNEISSARQTSQRLTQELSAPTGSVNFASSINSQVSTASGQATGTTQALYNANSLLTNDYQTEFNNAMAMVCQGHCSGGITDSLNRMHDIVANALNNIKSGSDQASAAVNTLNGVTSAVNQAQSQVNNSGSNNGLAIRDSESLSQQLTDIYTTNSSVAGQSNPYGISLPEIYQSLNTFAGQGCVNPNL